MKLAMFLTFTLLITLTNLSIIIAAIYHLLTNKGKPSQNPMRTVRTKFQQQCISVCATWNACKSYSVNVNTVDGANQVECQFYDKTFHENEVDRSKGSSYYVDPQTCQDWFKIGGRLSGVYKINWTGREMKEVRCNFELEGGGWLGFVR